MGKIGAILAQVISIPILSRDAPPNCSISAGSAGSTGSGRGGISEDTNNSSSSNTKNGAASSLSASAIVAQLVQEPLRWNPFAGGQSAGFLRRENGGTDDHNGNDNDTHIDIMTSPELAAQREAARHNKGSRKVISENSAHDNSITTKRCNTIANIQRPPPSQPRRRIKPQP
ncbi:MAG: hypothetical protein STHCBS139747_002512 [Sporothrix thermara]